MQMHLMYLKILEYGDAAAIASQTRFFCCAKRGVCVSFLESVPGPHYRTFTDHF